MEHLSTQTRAFTRTRGEWTAMAIKLPDGTYTRRPGPDYRLRRLLQVARDAVGRPLADCRVLDLACLEGHYAIEFALQGAESLGIEARQEHLDKCHYVRQQLQLERLSFRQDDVRNLSVERYGMFDIVICSGILYHLPAHDGIRFIEQMAQVCRGITLIDTYVSLAGRSTLLIDGRAVHGHHYLEHQDGDDAATRASRLWASIDNDRSFWFTEPTLINLLLDAGFTSVASVLCPTILGYPLDRRTYLACRGERVALLSSDPTQREAMHPVPEQPSTLIDPSQHEPGWLFKTARQALPPPAKHLAKSLLRAVGVLEPDATPDFMKQRRP